MRSLSLVRMPCFRRCSMISTTSPNHEGVEGTECEEVWMMTEESAILVMCTSLLGKMCILPQERHILCLLATNYISLRNSWDWVVADTVYGYDEMREWLESRQQKYVLAVPETHTVWSQGEQQPVG